jgi:hypothetical protein
MMCDEQFMSLLVRFRSRLFKRPIESLTTLAVDRL